MTPHDPVQKELAGVLVKLGCLSSAVDLLSRLQMWEELALCYQAVGRRAQAKAVVQEQLDAEPTPTLLCLMGDITQVSVLAGHVPDLLVFSLSGC